MPLATSTMIRTAGAQDLPLLADVIALAFQDDPVFAWSIRDPAGVDPLEGAPDAWFAQRCEVLLSTDDAARWLAVGEVLQQHHPTAPHPAPTCSSSGSTPSRRATGAAASSCAASWRAVTSTARPPTS